jgi:hypothetical protein
MQVKNGPIGKILTEHRPVGFEICYTFHSILVPCSWRFPQSCHGLRERMHGVRRQHICRVHGHYSWEIISVYLSLTGWNTGYLLHPPAYWRHHPGLSLYFAVLERRPVEDEAYIRHTLDITGGVETTPVSSSNLRNPDPFPQHLKKGAFP